MPVSDGDRQDERTGGVPVGQIADLGDLGRALGSAWLAAHLQRSTEAQTRLARAEAARDAVLASDADRDAASRLLADAYARGRLQKQEFDDRTTRALSARTHGDLDAVLAGLVVPTATSPGRTHPVRKVVFWVLAFLMSPFLFFGTVLALFGDDFEDHVGGCIMLVLTLPGLLALGRWAWPRRG